MTPTASNADLPGRYLYEVRMKVRLHKRFEIQLHHHLRNSVRNGCRTNGLVSEGIMAKPSKQPTELELELEILKVLWSVPASTGGEIVEHLAKRSRELTYSSVMTMLGIMSEKGFVTRKKEAGRFVYSARVSEAATTQRMLRDLVKRAYDGSVMAAVVNLLQANEIDAEEIKQLRSLLNTRLKEKQDD